MTTHVQSVFTRITQWLMSFFTVEPVDDHRHLTSITDTNQYLLPVVKCWGWKGYGYYAAHDPICIDRDHVITTEELSVVLGDKFRAPITVIGGINDIMERVNGISHQDFYRAKSFDYYQHESVKNQVRTMIAQLDNPVSVFNTWLATQVHVGTIVKIDGLQLKSMAVPDNLTKFFNRGGVCPLGEFIDRYYTAYHRLMVAQGNTPYSSIEIFARQLIFNYSLFTLGLSTDRTVEDLFPPYSQQLWELESKKSQTTLVKTEQL